MVTSLEMMETIALHTMFCVSYTVSGNLLSSQYQNYHDIKFIVSIIIYLGRAPHKRKVRAVGLSVCPYVHDTKIYKSNTNLRGTFSC